MPQVNAKKPHGISICESLLNRNKINPFLKRMVTGDEKWVTYDNVKRKWSWSNRGEPAQTVVQARIDGQEGFAVCLVGLAGNRLLELLPYGQTFNSDLYCQQLSEGSNLP